MSRVVAELIEGGVREFVVCGGARNASLVAAIVEAAEKFEDVRVWTQFEERSAGFFALGRTMTTQLPCAIVVTSGTAVGELLPAMMEAYYQGRPLIALTADRPDSYRGSGAPQAVEQPGIFGQYAEECAFADWSGGSPLHWNVPLDEDSTEEAAGEPGLFPLSPCRFEVGGLARFLREDTFRGLVVMLGGLDLHERESVYYFCKTLGVPVLADAASGLRELLEKQSLVLGDRLLKENTPGKILRLGEVPVGRFWRDLEDLPQVEVFSVCRTGLAGLARESQVVKGDVGRVLRGMGEIESIGDVLDHFRIAGKWRARSEDLLDAYPRSEVAMLRTLSVMATTGNSVFLGNSLPIREWGDFAQRVVAYDEVRAMRGANGIDGQVSCWLGASMDEEESWAILGDLTTLYDMQGLALAKHVRGKRVLIVINNHGGRIFDRLPRLTDMTDSQKDAVVQAQDVNFSAVAETWGLDFVKVQSDEDFDKMDNLGEKMTLVEVIPDAEQTKQFWERYQALKV